MNAAEVKHLRQLTEENARRKKLRAECDLEIDMMKKNASRK